MAHDTKLVLFDIDGTLLWSRGSGREATRAAMIEVFGTCGALDTHHFGGKTDWQTLAELLAEDGYSPHDIGRHMPTYMQSAGRYLAQMIPNYVTQPCPGALETVHRLRSRDDILIGIVTGNVATTAPIKLRAAGFNPDWFPVGAYGSEAMDRNDLPSLVLERAASYLKQSITPEQVIIIGDTLADVACARAVGAQAVAVLTGFSKREELAAAAPDHLIDDLTSLASVLNL